MSKIHSGLIAMALAASAGVLSGSAAHAQFGALGERDLEDKPGPDFVVVRARGRVESMTGSDRFVLSSKGMRFRVDYRPKDRRVNFRQGDQVHLRGALTEPDRITASELVVTERGRRERVSRTLTGTLSQVNRNTRRLVVDTAGRKVTVVYNDRTEFFRNSGRGSATDFRVGEAVRIVGAPGADRVVVARRIYSGGRPGFTSGAVGEIVGLDARDQEIDVDFDGEVWTVRLRQATLKRANRRLQIEDLRLGQDVRVNGSARPDRNVDASAVEVLLDPSRDRD